MVQSSMKWCVALLLGCTFVGVVHAQNAASKRFGFPGAVQRGVGIASGIRQAPLLFEIPASSSQDRSPQWGMRIAPRFSRSHGSPEISALKLAKEKVKEAAPRVDRENTTLADRLPVVGTNFEGNWSDFASPPDNALAVSRAGLVVSANNDAMMYFSSTGDFLFGKYWYDFIGNPNFGPQYFDPRVVYDPEADRFAFVILNGFTAEKSTIFLGFSKSNDPRQGWNVYMIPGNVLGSNCWFDFPNLALSRSDLFLTGNLFNTDGSGFQQGVILQVAKSTGYAGTILSYQTWSNLPKDTVRSQSMVPVPFGGDGSYGPGIYLVATEARGGNRIRVFDVTDDLGGSPRVDSYLVDVLPYSPAPNAYQKGSTDRLDIGDCRILSTFYRDDLIHLAFHSDLGQGWCGVQYIRIDTKDWSSRSSVYGMSGSHDYCYPTLVPVDGGPSRQEVLVGFLRSSKSIYPEFRVTLCDQDFIWSPSVLVKEGETFVNFKEDSTERWGDYITGVLVPGSSPPRAWIAGCYGANTKNRPNTYKAWIAEITVGGTTSVSSPPAPSRLDIFPNPARDVFTLSFFTPNTDPVTVEILDALGARHRLLYEGSIRRGDNVLTFHKNALPSGVYRVVIRSRTGLLSSQALVVVN